LNTSKDLPPPPHFPLCIAKSWPRPLLGRRPQDNLTKTTITTCRLTMLYILYIVILPQGIKPMLLFFLIPALSLTAPNMSPNCCCCCRSLIILARMPAHPIISRRPYWHIIPLREEEMEHYPNHKSIGNHRTTNQPTNDTKTPFFNVLKTTSPRSSLFFRNCQVCLYPS
jgi:hypothetical protein